MTIFTSPQSKQKFVGLALAIIASTAALALPTLAQASEPPSLTVKFGDLNIANDAGAEQLYRRINHAALEVCEPLDGRQIGDGIRFKACVKESIARAVFNVNQPKLSAVFEAKNGKTGTVRLAAM
jgi:UrcA family protein